MYSMINVRILIWKKWGHKEPFHQWFFVEPLKRVLCSTRKGSLWQQEKNGSLKNLSQNGSLGNQKRFFYGIAVKPPFWFFLAPLRMHKGLDITNNLVVKRKVLHILLVQK